MIMRKLFEKCGTLFCMVLIVLYIVTNSLCIENFGLVDYRSVIINTIFSIGLIILMIMLKRMSYY